jgi:hypothetical protein
LNDHRDAREAKGILRTLPKGNSPGGGGGNSTGRHNSKSNRSNKDKKKFKSMVAAAIAQAKVDTTKKAATVASVDADFQAYVLLPLSWLRIARKLLPRKLRLLLLKLLHLQL